MFSHAVCELIATFSPSKRSARWIKPRTSARRGRFAVPSPYGSRALAYLFAVSKGDRGVFDDFWRIIADPIEWGYSEAQVRYFRATHARTALKGIARSVGYPETPEAVQRLSVWRKGAKPVPPDKSPEF